MAVCGSLDTFSLLEIFDLVMRKQGRLVVSIPDGEARFWVRDGGISVACDCSWLRSGTALEQVVFDVLMQRGGKFDFELDLVPHQPMMTPAALLRAVDSLAMEWEDHGRIAASDASVVSLNANPERSELVVDRSRWTLVHQLLGGPQTVAQLGGHLRVSELELRRVLSDAFNAGLVTVDGRQVAPPPPDPMAPTSVAVSLESSPMPPVPRSTTIGIALSA
jgi:hypothetical protein